MTVQQEARRCRIVIKYKPEMNCLRSRKCLENGFSSKIGHVYKIGFSDDMGQPFPVCQF